MRSVPATLGRLWPWLAAIASGLLGAACFPPFNQDWLAWIALTPLIAATWFSGKSARGPWLRNLLLGYVSGLVFFTTGFSWLGSLGILFDNVWLCGLPLLLSLYLALHWAFWGWFVSFIAPRGFTTSWRKGARYLSKTCNLHKTERHITPACTLN